MLRVEVKPVTINNHLVVFIQRNPGVLRGLKSLTFAKIELLMYYIRGRLKGGIDPNKTARGSSVQYV